MSIWRYADWIAPIPASARVTLEEGQTPLVKSRRIGPGLGVPNLYFKLESCNPTGSYKDRFAVVAVADMVARGKTKCVATSSGNTGAALAGYCAAAGISCSIAVVEGCPIGKLQQMLAYGARIARIRGFGIDPDVSTGVFQELQRLGEAPHAALQISAFKFSPVGMSGVQTIGFELAEQAAERGLVLDHVFTPAGAGGATYAIACGFQKLVELGRLSRSPRVECVQPEGNDTIATPLRTGQETAREIQCTSKVSGLQVPNVIDGNLTITACRASGGTGHAVSDEAVWRAQARLAREEGIFAEPAGSAAFAGLLQALEAGEVDRQSTVVCLVSGSGFKDPASIERLNSQVEVPTIEADELRRVF